MIELRHPVGELIRLQTSIVAAGAGVSGLSPTIRIRRQSDGKWFNGTIVVPADPFQVAVFSNAMVELDAINLPGVYYFDFTQSRDTIGLSDYSVRMFNVAVTPAVEDLILRTGPQLGTSARAECTIFGVIKDASGNPLAGVQVSALTVPVALQIPMVGISLDESRVNTDENGLFEISLLQGLKIHLQIPAIGYSKRVTVPATSTADFTGL